MIENAEIQTSSLSMWAAVWKLLHLRILIITRGFRRSNSRQKFGLAVLVIAIAALLGFIFYLSLSFLRLLDSPILTGLGVTADQIMDSIPVLILSGAFIGILFTSFGVLLQALYLSGDMDFLLSAPIPTRSVFVAKLVQAILPNFGLICLFALPVLFGLGVSSGFTLLYYPMVVLVLSALSIAAAGIASLLVMGVVRVFPARRVAEILGFLGGIISILCAQTGQIANWSEISQEQTQRVLELISRASTPWSPLAWASWAIFWIGQARWLEGFAISAAVVIICGVIFSGALITAEKLYYSGWARLQNRQRKAKVNRQTRRLQFHPGNQIVISRAASVVIQIVQKDFLMLRRDIRNMSQLITPLIVGVVYFVMLLRGETI